jgi:hypothetical protein
MPKTAPSRDCGGHPASRVAADENTKCQITLFHIPVSSFAHILVASALDDKHRIQAVAETFANLHFAGGASLLVSRKEFDFSPVCASSAVPLHVVKIVSVRSADSSPGGQPLEIDNR